MDDGGGGGGGGGSIRLVCESCNTAGYYNPDDAEDGFFSCPECCAVHTLDDFQATGQLSYHRVSQAKKTPKPRTPAPPYPTPHHLHPPAAPAFAEFDDDDPLDFGTGAEAWGEPEELGARIRLRYVQGLQVILQQQLEVLVKRYRVSALVCGLAGTVWVRWVATSRVFDEIWARKVLVEDEAVQRLKCPASGGEQIPEEVKCEWEDEALPRKDRRRVEFIFLRSLRTMLPVY